MFRIMGSGAAEFIEEVGSLGIRYKRMPILVGKTLATSWTFGSGMACGKEGPGLLIGANLGDILSRKFKNEKLDKLDFYFLCASACTSAILKAPISGALFCAELPYSNHFRYISLLPSIFASTIGYLVFCLFFGFEPLIEADLSKIQEINYFTLLPLLVLFGIFMGLFVLIIMFLMRNNMKRVKESFRGRTGFWYLPLIGGIFYSIFLFIAIPLLNPDQHNVLIGPDTSLLSYITNNISGFSWQQLLILTILFIIAMALSIGFYNSAGIILPLMLFGALSGGFFGILFYPEYPELFILLGISAALGAAINNPITAIIIIVEMTWEPFLFIPAGIATIIAYIFSGPNTIVQGQIEVNTEKPTTEPFS